MYVVIFQPVPSEIPADLRLRRLLKDSLRRYKLRATDVSERDATLRQKARKRSFPASKKEGRRGGVPA